MSHIKQSDYYLVRNYKGEPDTLTAYLSIVYWDINEFIYKDSPNGRRIKNFRNIEIIRPVSEGYPLYQMVLSNSSGSLLDQAYKFRKQI